MKQIIDGAKEQTLNESKVLQDRIDIEEWVNKERNYARKM